MAIYYNENDSFAAAWLRNLIAGGHIAPGDVDERSIVDVEPDDLGGYTQHHFFAGIGGWSYALRLAGWDDACPVWTGSCPCQPFSGAGKRKAGADDRHLWPMWFRLIRECRPERVFGEQVEGASGLGWWDRVSADLEAEGYAVGAAVLGAHSVGAPHIRQRLYWVADAQRAKLPRAEHQAGRSFGHSASGGLGDADGARPQRRHSGGNDPDERSPWAAGVAIPCSDGKARRTQPGIFPLAHGVSKRVGLLRGAGNSVVPQVAAGFILAALEAR